MYTADPHGRPSRSDPRSGAHDRGYVRREHMPTLAVPGPGAVLHTRRPSLVPALRPVVWARLCRMSARSSNSGVHEADVLARTTQFRPIETCESVVAARGRRLECASRAGSQTQRPDFERLGRTYPADRKVEGPHARPRTSVSSSSASARSAESACSRQGWKPGPSGCGARVGLLIVLKWSADPVSAMKSSSKDNVRGRYRETKRNR